MAGQPVGMVTSIQPVAEIIQELVGRSGGGGAGGPVGAEAVAGASGLASPNGSRVAGGMAPRVEPPLSRMPAAQLECALLARGGSWMDAHK